MDITVIVPCFNSEKTLAKCLDSLIAQTKKVDIVIVNDGSTDNTLKVAEKYADNNDNVTLISHDNMGLPQSRKSGLADVESKWTAFVDSDDWVEKDMFETLFQLAEKSNADAAVCSLFNDKGSRKTVSVQKIADGAVISGTEALLHIHKKTAIYPFMWNKLFLTSLLKKNAVFPTGNFLGEDYTTLISFITGLNKIAVTQKPLYHYILHENSMSKGGYNDSYKKAFHNYSALYSEYRNKPEICGINNEMAGYLCVEFSAIYVSMIRNSNFDKTVVGEIKNFIRENIRSALKENVGLYFKISLIMIAFTPHLFNLGYKVICRCGLQ